MPWALLALVAICAVIGAALGIILARWLHRLGGKPPMPAMDVAGVQARMAKIRNLLDPMIEVPNAEEIDPQAKALWVLLDNIDTMDDHFKFDDRGFRLEVRKHLPKRFEIISSDGHKLYPQPLVPVVHHVSFMSHQASGRASSPKCISCFGTGRHRFGPAPGTKVNVNDPKECTACNGTGRDPVTPRA